MNSIEINQLTGIVYRWKNLKNAKWYIGSHEGCSQDGYLASGKLIQRSFKKHGIGNFVRQILYEGEDFKEVEEFILEFLDAASDPMSYNLKNAAVGGDVWKGRKDTVAYKEYLLKLSQPGEKNGMYNKKHSEESKDLMRQSRLGGTPWNKGKTGIYSEETLKKRAKSREGFTHSAETRKVMSKGRLGGCNSNAKPVTLYGSTYQTLQEACQALGLSLYKLHQLLKVYQDFRD